MNKSKSIGKLLMQCRIRPEITRLSQEPDPALY
jgi:hypothetical protein